MVWSNDSHLLPDSTGALYNARTGIPVRESSMFFISYWAHTTPLRTRKGIDTTKIDKNPARMSYLAVRGPYGPLTVTARAVRGLFVGCSGSQNRTWAVYGPRTGRQNSYGAARGLCGPREWTFDFCSKQPGNSPYGARECDVTGTLGIWLKPKHGMMSLQIFCTH